MKEETNKRKKERKKKKRRKKERKKERKKRERSIKTSQHCSPTIPLFSFSPPFFSHLPTISISFCPSTASHRYNKAEPLGHAGEQRVHSRANCRGVLADDHVVVKLLQLRLPGRESEERNRREGGCKEEEKEKEEKNRERKRKKGKQTR